MTDSEIAERITQRRARVMPVLVILFITQQASFSTLNRPVDGIRIGAWFVMSIALLLFLATGGGWVRSRKVRALINDETTRVHRQQACVGGFVCAMASCIVLYALSLIEPVTGLAAAHYVMTIGIGGALMRFGTLERRAYSNAEA